MKGVALVLQTPAVVAGRRPRVGELVRVHRSPRRSRSRSHPRGQGRPTMGKPKVVIVGAGFAGYHAARTLSRLSSGRAEIALINPTDYFLYLSLLPEVAAGV